VRFSPSSAVAQTLLLRPAFFWALRLYWLKFPAEGVL
jgi:hypothetical protein